MKVAADTNVLVYAQGFGNPDRVARAIQILDPLDLSLVVSTQVLGELFNVLTRKFRLTRSEVMTIMSVWLRDARIFTGSSTVMLRSLHLAGDHGLQIWDAFIIESAVEADCKILLSEDMQHGFFWNGLTIINPFLDPPHPLLAEVLASATGSFS